MKPILSVLLLLGCMLPGPHSGQGEKITSEQLVARHLESIGTKEARSAVQSRVASGRASLLIRLGGAANLEGTGMMASMQDKLRFGMRFSANDYVGEDMAFDGNQASTGFQPQGKRSLLSQFLDAQPVILKEALIGGVLSTAWPLGRMEKSQPKLEYRGLKKIEDVQLHEVSYRARKGAGDLKIMLYFEPQLFRHVKSKYNYQVGAGIATREAPNANPEIYYSLTEDFGDFRTVDGLNLPHKYKLAYSGEGRSASSLQEWTFIIDQISHKETIDSRIFAIK
jgi:hypothetical protein